MLLLFGCGPGADLLDLEGSAFGHFPVAVAAQDTRSSWALEASGLDLDACWR